MCEVRREQSCTSTIIEAPSFMKVRFAQLNSKCGASPAASKQDWWYEYGSVELFKRHQKCAWFQLFLVNSVISSDEGKSFISQGACRPGHRRVLSRRWLNKGNRNFTLKQLCPKKREHLQNVPPQTAQAFKSHVQLSPSQRWLSLLSWLTPKMLIN